MIWQPIVQLHNDSLLWLIQAVFYAHPGAAMTLLFVVLVGLPSHRRSARLAAWLVAGWGLLCLAVYGMLSEAPLLGWFFVGLLLYRVLRRALWILPAPTADTDKRRRALWLGPKAAWTSWFVRDYLRADPRGAYWLDLARAVRGLPAERSAADRRRAPAVAAELPPWRAVVWRVVFRLVEVRIWLYRRLPAYWHRPHDRLDLHEEHVRAILEEESEAAYRVMLRSWTGRDFEDYCRRDPALRAIEHRRAGQFGRVSCLHREALVEYATFRRPWIAGDVGLLDAAEASYETWRRRCQYDMLWEHVLESSAESFTESEPAEEALELPTASGPGDPSISNEVSERIPEGDAGTPLVGLSDALPPGDDGSTGQPADAELFEAFTRTAPAAVASDDRGQPRSVPLRMSPRERERLADLRVSSSMLEAFLGLASPRDFSQAAAQLEPFLDNAASQRRLAANALLMLYCLRSDFAGCAVDRQKADQLTSFQARSFGHPTDDKRLDRQLRLLDSMKIDVFFERGEFAQVVDKFGESDGLRREAWKVLADAESALAASLRGQEALRDMLRYDAIGHYFQAGFCGVWTLEYAQRLLDNVPDVDAMLDLFRVFPVDIARPGMLTWSSASRPPAAPLPRATSSGKVVVEFSLVGARHRGKRREISRFPWTLGQGPNANTPFAPPARIAPVHVTLSLRRGCFLATDRSGGAGMFVNGIRSSEALLRPGDHVQFGNVMMEVISV